MRSHILLGTSLTLAAMVAAAANPDPADCQLIENDQARLECYDAAIANPVTPPSVATEAVPPAAPETVSEDTAAPAEYTATPDVPSQEELFGLSGEQVKRSYESAAGKKELKELKELSAVVTSIEVVGHGKLVVSLDNGQVWRQNNAPSIRLKVGDTIVVRKAAFGSFKMKKDTANASMRVTRVR